MYRATLAKVRWFLRKKVPPIKRMLLIESGPRSDVVALIPQLRASVCGGATLDLFTCLPDDPDGLGASARRWRSFNAATHAERWQMLLELRRQRHAVATVLCSNSPLLAFWKVALVLLLPAKILVVDKERGQFWLDIAHLGQAARLAVSRSGIRNPEFLRSVANVAFLPVGLCILLTFAAKVHLTKLMRSTRSDESEDGVA